MITFKQVYPTNKFFKDNSVQLKMNLRITIM